MSIPTRERCQMCHRISSVGFHVPDHIWQAAVHPHWQNSVLCVSCFVSQADEKLIRWDKHIKFYPVSLCTHLEVVVQIDMANRLDEITESYLRGHAIYRDKDEWRYCDTREPTATTWQSRPCGHCGQPDTPEGHDACLGELPGVVNACCGHGTPSESWIEFSNGVRIEGFVVIRKEQDE